MCTDILIPARCYHQVPVRPRVPKKHPQGNTVPISNIHKQHLTHKGKRYTLQIHRRVFFNFSYENIKYY